MTSPESKELIKILQQAAKSPELLKKFLDDLLTPGEFSDIITRWQIIRQLYAGIPQRQIAKNLGVSIAKITRGSRVMLKPSGGFQTILQKNGH